jgi:hypothetical protein
MVDVGQKFIPQMAVRSSLHGHAADKVCEKTILIKGKILGKEECI